MHTLKYYHLTREERHLIDFLFNEEHISINQIAKKIGRNKSTISREIKRNLNHYGEYQFYTADKKAFKRHSHKYLFHLTLYSEFSNLFKKFYDKRFHGVYATYQKVKKLLPSNLAIPSVRQVFNWFKKGKWVLRRKDRLRTYVKGRKRKSGIFSKFKEKYVLPIWVRPKYIDLRTEFGHWEADLIIGSKSTGFDNLITLNERKTRYLLISRIKSKNSMKLNSTIYQIVKENNLIIKSITIDNGIEFEKIGLLASWLKCKIYFCEPFASYQRGTNENLNGMVRRLYKKGTDFTTISDLAIRELQQKINQMPRKIFDWKSSEELFLEEMAKEKSGK